MLAGLYREHAYLLDSEVLKDNPHLFKGVLTGILRVAKESIGLAAVFDGKRAWVARGGDGARG